MKTFWKIVGWIVAAIVYVMVWASADQQQSTFIAYLMMAGMAVWAIIDHVNKKIAFLRVDMAGLERQIEQLREKEWQRELKDMKFYTMPGERDRA